VGTLKGRHRALGLDWLRDLPMLAGLWLLDRAAGSYPETKADRFWSKWD
jgi:hypothetical protein